MQQVRIIDYELRIFPQRGDNPENLCAIYYRRPRRWLSTGSVWQALPTNWEIGQHENYKPFDRALDYLCTPARADASKTLLLHMQAEIHFETNARGQEEVTVFLWHGGAVYNYTGYQFPGPEMLQRVPRVHRFNYYDSLSVPRR